MSSARLRCGRWQFSASTAWLLLAVAGWSLTASSLAQSVAASQPATADSAQNIVGQTINAVTAQPIPRALVHCGAQAVLTDAEGRFQFTVDGTNATLTAEKPGFYPGEVPGEANTLFLRSPIPDTPVVIRLYPEAILTGTVLSPDGEPLAGIAVSARRSVYDESGHRWIQGAFTQTDSHGEFRLPVSGGDYRLQTSLSWPNTIRSYAVAAVVVPNENSSNRSATIHVQSGETQHFELHPALLPVAPVTLRYEGSGGRSNGRLTALAADGTSFSLREMSTSTAGEMKTEMPVGSYTLEMRKQGVDGIEQAETRVTVGSRGLSGVLLRFSPIGSIPVEVVPEASATSDNTLPNANQLGLSLQSAALRDEPQDSLTRVMQRGDQSPAFYPAPGSYRLHAQSGGSWFIRSATYGTSDLLSQDLIVTPGAGSLPIRIVVSNQTASLTGIVRKDGQPVAGWIYLMSSMPSATPVLIVHANTDGSYTRSSMPPGSYRALAFERRQSLNLEDADTLAAFSNDLQSVTLNSGDKGSLDLNVTSLPEER